MNRIAKFSAMFGALIAAASMPADPLTVGDVVDLQEVGVSPNKIVVINSATLGNNLRVYAGITKLLVDGVAYDSFCIDPFQWSSSSTREYVVSNLAGAPLPYYSMAAGQAASVEKLWAMYYSQSMTATDAAGLQIAIWEVVGGPNFSIVGSDYGAALMIASLGNFNGEAADLLALSSRSYQDFVVQGLQVPDGGPTVVLLGVVFLGLAMIRRRFLN